MPGKHTLFPTRSPTESSLWAPISTVVNVEKDVFAGDDVLSTSDQVLIYTIDKLLKSTIHLI